MECLKFRVFGYASVCCGGAVVLCVASVLIKRRANLEPFKTVKGEATAEFIEKRSKFICYVKHVEAKEEAENYIKIIKSKHWDAKHNVFAYRINNENINKSSDDGEPAGSAGMPVLFMLQEMGLQDLVVVISRYFGGVLLGVGGLKRAYSLGAKLAIEACGICEMVPCFAANLKISYHIFEKIKNLIQEFGGKISGYTYTNIVEIATYINENKYQEFREAVREASCGEAEIVEKGKGFFLLV